MKIFPLSYTEKETSVITSMSVSKLQKSRKEPQTDIKEGKAPPFVKINGSVRYKWEDVMDFMDGLESVAELEDEKIIERKSKKEINHSINSPAAPFINRLNY